MFSNVSFLENVIEKVKLIVVLECIKCKKEMSIMKPFFSETFLALMQKNKK